MGMLVFTSPDSPASSSAVDTDNEVAGSETGSCSTPAPSVSALEVQPAVDASIELYPDLRDGHKHFIIVSGKPCRTRDWHAEGHVVPIRGQKAPSADIRLPFTNVDAQKVLVLIQSKKVASASVPVPLSQMSGSTISCCKNASTSVYTNVTCHKWHACNVTVTEMYGVIC
ncbi:TPA: hypothetical protein ACH3X1_004614 [Trebouxia sp. C0004]